MIRNSLNKRGFGLLTCGLAAVVALTGCSSGGALNSGDGSDGETVRWRMVTHQIPGTSRYDETVVPFVKCVEESSDGQLLIEPFGGDNLFPTTETFDSIADGTVQIAAIYSGYWTSKDPVFGLVPGIPGDPIVEYDEHVERNEELQPLISEAYEKFGIESLGFFDYAPEEILMSQVPIDSADDFKGLNIRAAGTAGAFYGALGASAISLSAPEIYTGLQLGTVDAAEYNDFLVNQEMGLEEVAKYVVQPALHVGGNSDKDLIANPDAWDSLPKNLKTTVLECRDTAREKSATSYADANEEAKQDWVDAGVEITTLPDAEVEKMRKVAANWLVEYKDSSELSAEYVDEYARVLNDLGYAEQAGSLGYTD